MLSTDWQMTDNSSLSHSTYYEPDYSDPADFRIWSETRFNVKITKKFSFALYLRFDYDNLVPPDVDKLFYTVNNSFSLKF
jgi:putative salt-induced outer membrane protein YdiY